MSRLYGSPGIFGGTVYTDESGQYVGESMPGILGYGSRDFYDANGKHIGYAEPSLFGARDIFSDTGDMVGYTCLSVIGGEVVYSNDGDSGWAMDGPLGPIVDIPDLFEY